MTVFSSMRLLGTAAAATGVFQTLGFIHGYIYQTETLFDFIGAANSLSFIPLAYIVDKNVYNTNRYSTRTIIAASVFGASRTWLLAFLAWRAKDRKGDGRFDELKKNAFTFAGVWIFQAIWVYAVALPFLVIAQYPVANALNAADITLFSLFGIGLITEIASDITKTMWVKNGRPGGFCTDGLWAFSRHPNYFGEMLMWFCLWGITWNLSSINSAAVSPGLVALSALSPLVTSLILLFVSGIPMAEGQALKRYYEGPNRKEYIEYRENTSILIPMPCWMWQLIPGFLKKSIFFEFSMYEYKEDISAAFTDTNSTTLIGNEKRNSSSGSREKEN